MTLILKLDLDMVKMYLHAKKWGFHVKGFKSYSLNRQTHSQTDMTENITYLDTRAWIKHGQECIPVGCVPAARWPYAAVCLWGGCLLLGVAPGGSALGGCLLQRDGVSQHALRQTPPPVDRILGTRLWKYYLGPTSLRPVTRKVLNVIP